MAEERKAEIDQSALLFSNCSPRLLEQKGLSLGSLTVANMNIGLGGKTLIELEQPLAYNSTSIFPPHTFRPGDLTRIEAHVSSNAANNPKKAKKAVTADKKGSGHVEGVVYKVSDSRIVIAADSDMNEDFELPERCRVLKLANSVTFDRMDKALDQLEAAVNGTADKSAPQMTTLMRVLLGLAPISDRVPIENVVFFDGSLNPSQKEAVKFCLESPEVACIHGPPGTGKTHTIIEIIRQLTSVSDYSPTPKRLLVCGASNLSVDNILERLLALPAPTKVTDKLRVTRLGHPARVMAHQGVLDSTLEVKASRTDQAALTKDVKNELEATLDILSGKGKGKPPRGAERRKMWDEVKALRKEYRQRERGIVTSVLKDSQIVLATCHSAGGRQMRGQEFDVVIIDEATQALEAVCWIPIFKAKKLILAGDPLQLPPTILSVAKEKNNDRNKKFRKAEQKSSKQVQATAEIDSGSEHSSSDQGEEPVRQPSKNSSVLRPPRSLETTLFDRIERMYGSKIKKMLQIQYRMHSQICEFPSKTLYGSKLESDPSVASHLLSDLPNTHADSEEERQELLATPIVFFDTAGCEYFEKVDADVDDGSRSNENEATLVKNWVDSLVSTGLSPDQISVITPYQAQVTLLSSLLRPEYPSLEIGTVDGMQGREKDAVVISLVRSNEKKEVGFLKDKRRLNVAMTRAKRSLCIIGDSSTVVNGGSFLKKWIKWLENNADVRYGGLE